MTYWGDEIEVTRLRLERHFYLIGHSIPELNPEHSLT